MSAIDNFNYAQALKDAFAPVQTVSRIPLDQALAMREVINERGKEEMRQQGDLRNRLAEIAASGQEARKTAAQEAVSRSAEAKAASERAAKMHETTERLNQRLDLEKRADAYRVPVTNADGSPRSQVEINADIDKAATSNVKNYQGRLNSILQQQENLYKNNTDLAAIRSKALGEIQNDPSLLQSLSPEAAAQLKRTTTDNYADVIRNMRTGMHLFDRGPTYAGIIDSALQARVGALAASSQDANLRNAADKAKTLNLLAQPLASELAKHMGNLSPAGVSEFTASQADSAVKGLSDPDEIWKKLGGPNAGPPTTGPLGPPVPVTLPKPTPTPAYPASPLTLQLEQVVKAKRAEEAAKEEAEHKANMVKAFSLTLEQQQQRKDELAALLKDSGSDPEAAYAYAKQLDKINANIAHNKALIQKYAAPPPATEAPAAPVSLPAPSAAPAAPTPALPTGATNAPIDANHPVVQAWAQKNGVDLTPPTPAIVQTMRQLAAQDGHSDADIANALQAAHSGDMNAIRLIAQYKARATAMVNGGALAASVPNANTPTAPSQQMPSFAPLNPQSINSFYPADQTIPPPQSP